MRRRSPTDGGAWASVGRRWSRTVVCVVFAGAGAFRSSWCRAFRCRRRSGRRPARSSARWGSRAGEPSSSRACRSRTRGSADSPCIRVSGSASAARPTAQCSTSFPSPPRREVVMAPPWPTIKVRAHASGPGSPRRPLAGARCWASRRAGCWSSGRLLPPVGGGPRDLLGPRPCPAMRVRLGMEALSGLGTDGRDLPSDAHALTAYAECGRDLGRAWQVAGGLRAYAWRSPGAEDLHDLEASVRLTRAPPGDEVHLFLDASWTTRYRRGVLHVERPISLAAWHVRPFVRLAWATGSPSRWASGPAATTVSPDSTAAKRAATGRSPSRSTWCGRSSGGCPLAQCSRPVAPGTVVRFSASGRGW